MHTAKAGFYMESRAALHVFFVAKGSKFEMQCKLFSFFKDFHNKTLATQKKVSYNTLVYAHKPMRSAPIGQ
jgi:hypothetical protein